MAAPHFTYFPIAGRGELTRLIAAAGGVEMTESAELAEGETKAKYMSPSGVPLLRHGELKMSQSFAIECYIASIAPSLNGLTMQQRAVDMQYQGIKEEILANCAKAVFTTVKEDRAKAATDVTALFDKWFTLFEEQAPEEGFIQGLGFPTVADLALLNITTAYMPFGPAKKLAEYDFDKYPKCKALCARTAAVDRVASYVAASVSTDANPWGM